MKNLTLKDFTFEWGSRTYVMGILNITPDSFSGDGLADQKLETILGQARDFVEAGVDILDVGGESTRPGAAEVSAQEEIDRVLPVISALAEEFETLVSIDTYKSDVAREAVRAGASILNYVWGLMVEYLAVVKVLSYEQTTTDSLTKDTFYQEMMAWRESLRPSGTKP